jgi:hypothetical protein
MTLVDQAVRLTNGMEVSAQRRLPLGQEFWSRVLVSDGADLLIHQSPSRLKFQLVSFNALEESQRQAVFAYIYRRFPDTEKLQRIGSGASPLKLLSIRCLRERSRFQVCHPKLQPSGRM